MNKALRGLLLDLDGVFYVGNELIEGAQAAVAFLKRHAIPHLYLTNTTTRSLAELERKLHGLGLPINAEQILSAPLVARRYLQAQGISRCQLLLREGVKEDFAGLIEDDQAPEAVVIGDIGDAWNYTLLNRVFRHLIAGAHLIALHRNRYWQTEDGLRLDIGAFVSGLEYAADTQAVIMGKPSADFFEIALHTLGLAANEVAMLGDDIESDVGGAQDCGITGVLVRTGKYRPELIGKTGVQPDYILDSIADLPDLLR